MTIGSNNIIADFQIDKFSSYSCDIADDDDIDD
jgi:hypothetical protein